MTHRRTLLAAALLVPVVGLALAAGRLDETAAVKKTATDFQAAWNKHDGKAMAACWAKDGDLIDPHGKAAMGSADVEKYFATDHSGTGPLAKTTFDIKKDSVRFITPDVALSDWDVVITGLPAPEGAPAAGPVLHRVVIVSKKEGGSWKFAAARASIPEPEGAKMPEKAKPAK